MPSSFWTRRINFLHQACNTWTSSLAWAAPPLATLLILSPSAYSQTPIEASAPSRNLAAERQIDGAGRPGKRPDRDRPLRRLRPKRSFQNICERLDALNSDGIVCDLSSKGITSLNSDDFHGLSNLEYLYLNNNNLSSFPENIFDRLSDLNTLSLTNNDLKNLP
ncbi:MAG: leucine-rich repeat domain-containing protein, partial [Aphanocapsa feldmannii 288cV]